MSQASSWWGKLLELLDSHKDPEILLYSKKILENQEKKFPLISMETTYYTMLEHFRQGKITEKEWQDFCKEMLIALMEKHKDVFVRLKNR